MPTTSDDDKPPEPTPDAPKQPPMARFAVPRAALARALAWTAARVRGASRASLGGGAALAVALVVVAIFLALRSHPARAPAAGDASLAASVACTGDGGVDRDGQLVFGELDGRVLSAALRAHELQPDDAYRARQAFERLPGFRAPSAGRFVAKLGAKGSIEALDLVVSSAESYVARVDAKGELVGERSARPAEERPCSGALRVGASFAETLRTAPFQHEIADALEAALGAGAASATAPGTQIRVVARELRALGAFAGYDGLEAVEITPAGEAKGRRTYRFEAPGGAAYFDAEGKSSTGGGAVADAQRDAFRRRVALLDARLDAMPAPPVDAQKEAPPIEEAEPVQAPSRDREEPKRRTRSGLSVERSAKESCSTRVVEGLSHQIIAEARCLKAAAFSRIPGRQNLHADSNVVLYLEAPARDQLLAALDANPGKVMTVNSALRTLPQQVLLAIWGRTRRCGVKLAALPGESNHESGLALDIREASAWRPILEKRGFRWMGAKDPVHFDYDGLHAVDHRGLDVLAFQRLWNRNNPAARLTETGRYDASTAAKIEGAPASGFATGARCEGGR